MLHNCITHHTPRETARHERKTKKQHQSCLPSHPSPAVAVAVGAQTRFLDRIDNKHSQGGTDARYPVHEIDVDRTAIEIRVRIGRSIDEEEETEGELVVWHSSVEFPSLLDIEMLGNRADEEKYRYQCASEVDSCRPSVRTVQPFRLGEPKQLVATHAAGEYRRYEIESWMSNLGTRCSYESGDGEGWRLRYIYPTAR